MTSEKANLALPALPSADLHYERALATSSIEIGLNGACARITGMPSLYRSGSIAEAGSWAHARRKFDNLYELDRFPITEEALRRNAALYVVEREVRGQTLDVRVSARQ